jgi:hypothetical protein
MAPPAIAPAPFIMFRLDIDRRKNVIVVPPGDVAMITHDSS